MEHNGCPKHELVSCPRCNQRFECRVGSINLCQCQTVVLNHEQRQYVESRYVGCLCAECLLALRAAYNRSEYDKAITKILYGH